HGATRYLRRDPRRELSESASSSRLLRPISSAICHRALPRSAPFLLNRSSSSPASDASRCARRESLSAEAVATSAAATTSATSGFWSRSFPFLAAPLPGFVPGTAAEPAFLDFLSFLPAFFCFFLSLATLTP